VRVPPTWLGHLNRLSKVRLSKVSLELRKLRCIQKYFPYVGITWLYNKALHSELLTELSGRFPSRNEYFVISEVRIWHHFFVIFGKFGISKFPKFPKVPNIRKNQFPKLPNFFQNFRTFSELFTELFQTFWPKNRIFCPKTSNFTSFFQNFQNLRNFRIITELFFRT